MTDSTSQGTTGNLTREENNLALRVYQIIHHDQKELKYVYMLLDALKKVEREKASSFKLNKSSQVSKLLMEHVKSLLSEGIEIIEDDEYYTIQATSHGSLESLTKLFSQLSIS